MRIWGAIILLAWGVLSLGASEPWGYVPLLAAMSIFGVVSLGVRDASEPIGRALTVALTALCVAVLLQIVPLPAAFIRTLSPAAQVAAGGPTESVALPLSVDPPATGVGFMFVTAASLFFVGLTRSLRGRDAQRFAVGLVGLGALVAAIGLAEQFTAWGGVYRMAGLALPPDSSPLGPFASRNHFAGWVLMALPVLLGYLCGMLEPRLAGARARRTGTLELARPQGTLWAFLVTLTAASMVLVLIQTRSRAAILGLVAALALIGVLMLRRQRSTTSRILFAAPILIVPLMGAAITGFQPIFNRFATHSWSTAHGRLPIWRQAIGMARDFPITGSGFNTYQTAVRFYPAAGLDEPYEGAHNDFLQLAVEGGLLVGIPALSAIALFVRQTRRRFRDSSHDAMTWWIRVGAVTGLLLIAGQEMVDFSLQVPGNAALCAALAAVAIHRRDTTSYA